MSSIVTEAVDPEKLTPEKAFAAVKAISEVSDWSGTVGLSEFASFDQDGIEITDPVFPYHLKYTPNPAL